MRSEDEVQAMYARVSAQLPEDAAYEDELTALYDALTWVLHPEVPDDRIDQYFDIGGVS